MLTASTAFLGILCLTIETSCMPVDYGLLNCISTPILAPEADCRGVLAHLYREWVFSGADRVRTWGRTVDPQEEDKVQLPVGYQLKPIYPWQEPLHCEIHVDNRSDRWSQTDSFTMRELIDAAVAIFGQCYPNHLTGKSYPAATGNVYVTTLYSAGNAATSENTTVVELESSPTISNAIID